jgi:hypothetical protein
MLVESDRQFLKDFLIKADVIVTDTDSGNYVVKMDKYTKPIMQQALEALKNDNSNRHVDVYKKFREIKGER